MTLPTHIAIIPDGNRRWAKERGKPSFFGHRAGVKIFETTLEEAIKHGITYTTFWGCSIDNLQKRDSKEIAFLLQIFKLYFTRLATSKRIQKNGVKIRVLGQWKKMFPPDVKEAVEKAIVATKNNSTHHLTLLLAYNGNEEMLNAVSKLTESGKPVSSETLKNNLYTKELPTVDLVIRTGGDPHLSNGFMMWDTQDSELYFTNKMWPDFSSAELQKALQFFARAGRRLGK